MTLATLPPCLSPEQAAAYLGLPVKSIRTALRRGELRGVRIMRRWRIRREDLDRLFGDAPPPAPLPDRVPEGRPAGRPRKVRRRSVVVVPPAD